MFNKGNDDPLKHSCSRKLFAEATEQLDSQTKRLREVLSKNGDPDEVSKEDTDTEKCEKPD